ncbi:MAG: SDR family oxidoreductase [Saprospiraceae bacterium]|nr:SDR family oxidoreductase [Saprospiraceae bacterium]
MNVLLTGGAGFIGANITAALLNDPRVSLVRILDNLATGRRENLAEFEAHPKFEFVEADIRDYDAVYQACTGIDRICHQAALGSVPRSIGDPITSNAVNVDGTLNVFWAAHQHGIKRVVYAASSSTYGDSPDLPKREDRIGRPLSPYAVTKLVNELYADVFGKLYGLELIGLRYFNIFGPKQNPQGPYAAVIPLFCQALLDGRPPTINGDGLQSRDFTYVDNAVQANLLALFTDNPDALNQVYNIACGEQTTLVDMYARLQAVAGTDIPPVHGPERAGDVRHSLADISRAERLLGYAPAVGIHEGLKRVFDWYAGMLGIVSPHPAPFLGGALGVVPPPCPPPRGDA